MAPGNAVSARTAHRQGPVEWFTGNVYIDAIARGEDPSHGRVSAVRFTPVGPLTARHSHAVGQTLYVTEGQGLHQERGAQIEEIHAGDIVYTLPTNGTGTAPHPATS